MRIDHIALYCQNIETMRAFFEHFFEARSGAKYHNTGTGFQSYFLSFPDGNTCVEIMTRPEVKWMMPLPFASGLQHICLGVGSRDLVDTLTQRIEDAGFTIHSRPRTTGDGYYESCVIGPEGVFIEITV